MIDINGEVSDSHPLLSEPRCPLGLLVDYIGAPIGMDGSAVTTISLNRLAPRGESATLPSVDPRDSVLIDHKHLSTEKDKLVLWMGARKALELMSTPSGKEIVSGEVVGPNKTPLMLGSVMRKLISESRSRASKHSIELCFHWD